MKPLYPKSNRTWATGLQDLHWDFQSQVMQMKMYFQCYFNIILRYYFQYYIIFQVLDLNDPKLVQAIWKPEVLYLEGFGNTPNTESTFQLYPWPGLLPKCQGGRIPVCYGSQSTSEHQAPWSDSLYAQVSIFNASNKIMFLIITNHISTGVLTLPNREYCIGKNVGRKKGLGIVMNEEFVLPCVIHTMMITKYCQQNWRDRKNWKIQHQENSDKIIFLIPAPDVIFLVSHPITIELLTKATIKWNETIKIEK